MRKRDTTEICVICIEVGHIYKSYMNIGRIEDEKKDKADNIRKQMRQQWIPKSCENASLSHEANVTQELGDSSISS